MKTTGRQASAARTRARVLEAATRVIAEAGPDGASVQRITAEAGVSQGVVGWQFGSKNALVTEVVEAALRDVAETLAAALTAAAAGDRQHEGAADGLRAPFGVLAGAFGPLLGTPPGRVLVTSLAHVIPDEDALRDAYSAGLGALVDVAAEAARLGDPGLTEAGRRRRATAFVSTLLGYASQRVLDPELDPDVLHAAAAVFDAEPVR